MRPSRGMMPAIMLALEGLVMIVLPYPIAQVRAHDGQRGGGRASTQAFKRLMKELKDFYRSDSYLNGIFTVELIDDDIYEWHVKLFINDPKSPLYGDLQKLKENGWQDHVLIHVKYNDNYPLEPLFVRVVYPYLDRVDSHGALCMELLWKNGWNSSYTIEPLILSIAVEKINKSRVIFVKERFLAKQYTYENAKESYKIFEKIHVENGKWS